MTCGLYILNFKGTNKVYIGKSKHIERRFKVHEYRFKTYTHTSLLNEAYKLFGMPDFNILLECEEDSLADNEVAAIEIYDSINNGFNHSINSSEGYTGYGISGEDHHCSTISNAQAVEIVNTIINNPDLPMNDISVMLNISPHIVKSISIGSTHKYLAKLIPEEYSKMLSYIGKRSLSTVNKVYPEIISPKGEIHKVNNISKFAREHKLAPAKLNNLLNGRAKSTEGWKVYKPIEI